LAEDGQVAEEWFDAKIAPASAQVAAASSTKSQANSEAVPASGRRQRKPEGLEEWYVNEHIPAGYASREEDLAAARKRFGRWSQDWLIRRELRGLRAPPDCKKSGPK
jgi:hypothetical protein